MKNKSIKKLLPGTKNLLLLLITVSVAFFASSFKKDTQNKNLFSAPPGILTNSNQEQEFEKDFNAPAKDSMLSKQAFLKVYEVLMSPRCMNCHPAGDVPLQGDESKLHTQNVKRGPDGKGLYAAKCANCHQEKNQPGLHMPPGNPNWHLPPSNMKMVFEGKTPRELAAQLLNPQKNGNKTIAQLVKHISSDGLVLAGWDAGEGRKQPPQSHEEFTKHFIAWIENGAYLPEK